MNEFSIYHIFRLLCKNFLVIILCAILCGAATFCYCEFKLEERFAATGSVLVTNGGIVSEKEENPQINEGKVNNSDITASINLLDTVKDILSTNEIYEELSEKLAKENIHYSAAQLDGFATISTREDYSLFIDVRFEMNDPELVVTITNMFLELTPEYINGSIPNSHTRVYDCDGVGKTYPRTVPSTALAMLIGALVAFVVVYIISLFNTTIQTEEDFKERYNIPVLGDIPDFAAAKSGKYAKSYYKGGNYYGN